MAVHVFPFGETAAGDPLWVIREKATEVARVVLRDEQYHLYWQGKWQDIYANNTFGTLDETVQWVTNVFMMARTKTPSKYAHKGKGITLAKI